MTDLRGETWFGLVTRCWRSSGGAPAMPVAMLISRPVVAVMRMVRPMMVVVVMTGAVALRRL